MSNNGKDVIEMDDKQNSLKTFGHISYLLHLVVAIGAVIPGFQPGIGLLVIAFVIDLVKKDDAAGTWQESHFRWRIRSVVWAFGLYVLTSPLFLLLYLPGAIAWAVISIWFLYRVIRGWMNLNNGVAMPLPA
jgi:uncharacterized membrane protein